MNSNRRETQGKNSIPLKHSKTVMSSLISCQLKLLTTVSKMPKKLEAISSTKYKSPQRSILKSSNIYSSAVNIQGNVIQDSQKKHEKQTLKILKNTLRQKSQRRDLEVTTQNLCERVKKITNQIKITMSCSSRHSSANKTSIRSESIIQNSKRNSFVGKKIFPKEKYWNVSSKVVSFTRYLKTKEIIEMLSKFLCYKDFLRFLVSSRVIYRKSYLKQKLSRTLLKGLDPVNRKQFWPKKCRVEELKRNDIHSYTYYISIQSDYTQEIERDINRTFAPDHKFYSDPEKSCKLHNILKGLANKNFDIGYIQGLNFIGGRLLLLFSEELSFWILDSLLNIYELKEFLKPNMPRAKLACYQLDKLLLKHIPKVYADLHKKEISSELFCIQWFVTIFSYDFDSPFLYVIWDFFLIRKWKFIFQLSVAIIKQLANFIKVLDNEPLISYIKSALREGKLNPENLLRAALEIKITNKELYNLELKYQLLPDNNSEPEEPIAVKPLIFSSRTLIPQNEYDQNNLRSETFYVSKHNNKQFVKSNTLNVQCREKKQIPALSIKKEKPNRLSGGITCRSLARPFKNSISKINNKDFITQHIIKAKNNVSKSVDSENSSGESCDISTSMHNSPREAIKVFSCTAIRNEYPNTATSTQCSTNPIYRKSTIIKQSQNKKKDLQRIRPKEKAKNKVALRNTLRNII